MAESKTNLPKKKKNEMLMTVIFLMLMSAASAAFVIYFRIKMKPFQLPPSQTENSEQPSSIETKPEDIKPR